MGTQAVVTEALAGGEEEGVRGIDLAEGDYHYFLFLTLVTYLYFVHHEEEQVERKICMRGSVCRGAIGYMTLVHE